MYFTACYLWNLFRTTEVGPTKLWWGLVTCFLFMARICKDKKTIIGLRWLCFCFIAVFSLSWDNASPGDWTDTRLWNRFLKWISFFTNCSFSSWLTRHFHHKSISKFDKQLLCRILWVRFTTTEWVRSTDSTFYVKLSPFVGIINNTFEKSSIFNLQLQITAFWKPYEATKAWLQNFFTFQIRYEALAFPYSALVCY